MQKFRKNVIFEYVPIMEKTYRSGTRKSCVAQQSIYIMLTGNEETRSYITQVRNVLIHLRSDIIYGFNIIQCRQFQDYFFFWQFFRRFWTDRNAGGFKTNGSKACKIFAINSHVSELTDVTSPVNRSFVLHSQWAETFANSDWKRKLPQLKTHLKYILAITRSYINSFWVGPFPCPLML
jgi:hypothetical protein